MRDDPELAHLRELYEEGMEPEPVYRPPATPERIEKSRRLMTPAMKRVTAYHEAGHAVICRRERVPVTRLTIRPDGYALGGCTFDHPDMDCHGRIRQQVRIAMAGQIAERLSRAEWPKRMPDYSKPGYGSDLKLIERGKLLPECIFRSDDANTAWRRWQWTCVRDVLHEFWPQVVAVAEALLERETLSGDEVSAIIREVSA